MKWLKIIESSWNQQNPDNQQPTAVLFYTFSEHGLYIVVIWLYSVFSALKIA